MDTNERILECAEIAYKMKEKEIFLDPVCRLRLVQYGGDPYKCITSDIRILGIIGIKDDGNHLNLPKFISILSFADLTPFDYLILVFVSRYVHISYSGPALLEPPKIYFKEKKHYNIKNMIKEIGRCFKR